MEARILLTLVADFDPYPSNLTPAGSNLFYLVSDGTDSGVSLAATNASGTRVLKDFGTANPFDVTDATSGETKIATIGNSIYFVAGPFDSSPDLWTSDGTVAGTVVIATANQPISGLTAVGNHIYFSTTAATAGGQDALYSFVPGSTAPSLLVSLPSGSIADLTAVGGLADFAVVDPGGTGFTLWTSDGTVVGTKADPASRTPAARIIRIVDFNSQPILLTSVPEYDTPSVYSLTTITPSGPVSYGTFVALGTPGDFTPAGSDLYFTYYEYNIRYSPLRLARFNVATHDLTTVNSFATNPTNLTPMNGILYYTQTDFDGTVQLMMSSEATGTQFIKSLGPIGTAAYYFDTESQPDLIGALGVVGSTLYFAANDPAHGTELWKSDGTAAGTMLVKDINPGIASSSPQNLAAWNGQIYFSREQWGFPWTDQLWTSSGTPTGTTQVGSFATPPAPTIIITTVDVAWVKVGKGRKARKETEIVVHFAGSVDAATAQKAKNYVLVQAGRDKKYGTRDDRRTVIASARYDASARTVTLVPRGRILRFKPSVRLQILGKGILDLRGHAVDGGLSTTALLTKMGGTITASAAT